MATSPVTHGTRVPKLKHAFEWVFLLGFVVISATKLVVRGQPILGAVVAAVIGIIIMWIYAIRQKRERPESEYPRLGDEVYYLGLLYTLTSLFAALVSLFLLDGGERPLEERTNEMVGSFGVALLTTMAGIVMRIPLQRRATDGQATIIRIPHSANDSRGGTVEIEGVTIDLERYAYELRRQLQLSTNAFASHAGLTNRQAETIRAHMDETRVRMDKTHAHMDEMMKAFHEGLTEKARAGLERLETKYEDIAAKAEEVTKWTETQQASLRSALEKLEAQVKSMDESIERIRAGSGETAENLGAIGVQAKASTRALVESAQVVSEGLSALAKATDAEKTHHEARTQFAKEAARQADEWQREWTEIQQRAVEALKEVEQTNQAFAGLGEEARRTNKELTILPEGLHKAGEAVGRLVETTNASSELSDLKAQAMLVVDQLEGVAGASKRQEKALDVTVEKLHALAEAAARELRGQRDLKDAIAEVAEGVATAGRYGKSLKDTEREIQRINTGLKGVQSAIQDEGFKLAEVLKQAIIAFDEARQGGKSTKNWIYRVFRK